MGKLRTFVKAHRVDETARIRHHKHPRNLRIIEDYKIDTKMEEFLFQELEEARKKQEEENDKLVEENPILNEVFDHKIVHL